MNDIKNNHISKIVCMGNMRKERKTSEVKDKVYSIGWNNIYQLVNNENMMHYKYRLSSGEFVKMEVNKNNNSIKLLIMDDKRNLVNEINENEIVVGIVNLSNRGDRWEGSHWKEIPFGYGCLFDEENRMIYEGYMADGKKVCFGNEYYDNGMIRYRGSYVNDCKHGSGCLYDMRGNLIYEGEWAINQNDNFDVTIPDSCVDYGMTHSLVRELIIGDHCYNDLKELIIRNYPNMILFCVGRNSCKNIEVFELIDCDKLESMIVKKGNGWNCENKTWNGSFENAKSVMMASKIGYDLIISDLPQFTTFETGSYSFHNTTSLYLSSI